MLRARPELRDSVIICGLHESQGSPALWASDPRALRQASGNAMLVQASNFILAPFSPCLLIGHVGASLEFRAIELPEHSHGTERSWISQKPRAKLFVIRERGGGVS
jgi:hypothetical protein